MGSLTEEKNNIIQENSIMQQNNEKLQKEKDKVDKQLLLHRKKIVKMKMTSKAEYEKHTNLITSEIDKYNTQREKYINLTKEKNSLEEELQHIAIQKLELIKQNENLTTQLKNNIGPNSEELLNKIKKLE